MHSPHEQQRPTSLEHIVSRFYLNNFSDSEGTLYVYEQGKRIRESAPRRECAEHQFYEFNFNGNKSNNAFENWLSRIEADGSRILPLLCAGKQLDSREATAWACFVASLFSRTRKVRTQISAAMIQRMRQCTGSADYVRNMQHNLLKLGELHYIEDLKAYIERVQVGFESSPSFYHVTGIPRHTKIVAEALLRMDWHTLSAVGKSFVTSDSPVSTVQQHGDMWSEGVGFGRENVIVFLPLTPEKVFAASSHFRFKKGLGPGEVTKINRLTVRFAHKNVYADQISEDLRQLVDAEINQTVFGKNAFLERS
jgi:hypothetical protein